MQKSKSFEPILEQAMTDGVIKVSERIKIKDQIMIAKIISARGACESYLTFRDVKYFLGDERFKECIGEETYDKLKQLYIDNVDEADKEIRSTIIGDRFIRSIFELAEDAQEFCKECGINLKEKENEDNSDT